ncbi:MAG: hypothetical protein N2035_09465 [Chthoniobacterales bacterium]|nr:hypothetical protein [Chthoniobacterales bacterium]
MVLFFFVVYLGNEIAISFLFDYTYDTGEFITVERKNIVNLAASASANLTISRDALIPGGSNPWNWTFNNPSNNSTVTIDNPSMSAGGRSEFIWELEV